jgi:2',3'-cyclic-nucleotide 2'-phosphodiesterase / 3'-nucleotidase
MTSCRSIILKVSRLMPGLRAFLSVLVFALFAHAETARITFLATTDLHGNMLPYDYFTARPVARGLAKIATLIRSERAQNPNTLLIDCGDTIQGTPLEAVYQQYVETGRLPLKLAFAGAPLERDPMMLAMNAIGYDMMVVGNHEFNFGLKNLEKARSEAHFPWISASIHAEPGASVQAFAPYFVKTVGGVKIAVVGITTPLIPVWEPEEHYRGYRFEDGVDAARRTVAGLREREHPDLVIVAAHSGLDRDPAKNSAATGDSREDMVYQIATEVPGIDAIIFGHTHSQVASLRLGDVLLMQPKNWGMSLGRMDFVLDQDESGRWKIVSKASRLIPVTSETDADPKVLELAKPYHELAEKYLNTPVAETEAPLDARLARVEDSAIIDAVQQVELFYSKADVSFASSFNPRAVIPKGQVTVRQIASLYVYENQLYTVQGTGKLVREALENAARYFKTCSVDCSHGPLINRQVIGYNFDMAQGVNYDIDLTQPPGNRIRNLRWHGRPLSDDQPLRIAVNNYRAGGGAGYSMFRNAKVLWRSPEDIRDLVIQYYSGHGKLPSRPDNNWRILPEAARRELRAEALGEARNVTLK